MVAVRCARERDQAERVPHLIEPATARQHAARTGTVDAHTDGPVRMRRGARRRGGISRVRRRQLRHRPRARGRWWISREWSEFMTPLPARSVETAPSVHTAAGSIGRVRWTMCALLFAASTINYIDRQVLGILAPDLQRLIGWNELQYGYIVTSFQAAYAIGFLFAGRLIDRLGSRTGYAIAVGFWSVAAMAHGFATSALTFGAARFGL